MAPRQRTIKFTLRNFLGWVALVLFTIANMTYTVLYMYFEQPKCQCQCAQCTTTKKK